MYLYETHLHTAEVSRCATNPAKAQAAYYKEAGFDGIIITDHFLGGNTTVPVNLPWEQRIERFCCVYELAREEGVAAQAKAQGDSGHGHDEGLLKKLWHTFTSHKSN